MSSYKGYWKEEQLTCKPLDSYHEIQLFLQNPPPWRTLCKELSPHSEYYIRNIELCRTQEPSLESPETFCHFDPDAEDVQRHYEKDLPKTLVCHDMANGYHDDSIIDGTGNYDAYNFHNWAGIDVFCYFSHHLITIPPLAWINIGHAHGVKVIGTIITEWSEGVAFWDKILKSEEEYRFFANALVTIAQTLKFDGWLLNIENKIAKPDVLLEFVRYFHTQLHAALPHATLVWYDSVTVLGHLHWQNGLNDKNKDFFDACDGFFTNYSWTQEDVASSAQVAGDRLTDLYIGIDVFGRNFYGGGQFNTQKAVKVAHTAGCSLAIFAPAWTHEAMPDRDEGPAPSSSALKAGAPSDDLERFILRDRALWGSLWPFLNTRAPCQLPFQTSFCRGQGRKRWLYGEVVSPQPWFNLRHMQYQPGAAHGPHGYLLSTLADMVRTARAAVLRHPAGIIKYRQSFLATRAALYNSAAKLHEPADEPDEEPAEPAEEPTELTNQIASGPEEQQTSILSADIVSIHEKASEEESHSDDESGSGSKSVKRKMKDAFKQLFKKKSQPELSDDEAQPSWVSGRSLHKLSLMVRLGEKEDRTRWELAAVPEERECLELHTSDAFTGGACLRINACDEIDETHRFTRLFFSDFRCDKSFIVCVVTKNLREFPEQTLNVVLFMENAKAEELKVTLVGRHVHQQHRLSAGAAGPVSLYPFDSTGRDFVELQKYLLLHEAGFYVPVENSYHWTVRYYEVAVPGSRIKSINCRTGAETGGILLGYFGLCNRMEET